MLRALFLALVLLTASPAVAATYYVKTTGDDAKACTDNGANACKTIARGISVAAFNSASGCGNTVKIAPGIYHERVTITGSTDCTAGTPMTLDIDGATPSITTPTTDGSDRWVLDGSHQVTWSNYSGNIWQATLPWSGTALRFQSIVVNDRNTWPVGALADVGDDRFYLDKAAGVVYFQPAEHTSPASQRTLVEAYPNSTGPSNGITIGGYGNTFAIAYITVQNGAVVGATSANIGMNTAGDHITVDNMVIAHGGTHGIALRGRDSTYVLSYPTIQNSAFYNNVLMNWPRGGNGGGWGGGAFGSSVTHLRILNNTATFNHGESFGVIMRAGGQTNDNLIQGNTVTDGWSVGIYSTEAIGTTIDRNIVACHTRFPIDSTPVPNVAQAFGAMPAIGSDFYNNYLSDLSPDSAVAPDYTSNVKFSTVNGVLVGDENVPSNWSVSAYVTVTNNLIINCRTGISFAPQPEGATKHMTFAFNTIVMPAEWGNEKVPEEACLKIALATQNTTGTNEPIDTLIRNNLCVIQNPVSPTTLKVQWFGVHTADTDLACPGPANCGPFQGVTWDHNAWWKDAKSTNSSPFNWETTAGGSVAARTVAAWCAITGNDCATNVTADPNLVNYIVGDPLNGYYWTEGGLTLWNFAPQAGSPLLAAATPVSGVTTDILGNTRNALTPTIGAFEGTSALSAVFLAPTSGATVSGSTTVTVSASGGTAPYTYSVKLDGAEISTSASFSWNTTLVANGAHTLSVTATDAAAGTSTASEPVTVTNVAVSTGVWLW